MPSFIVAGLIAGVVAYILARMGKKHHNEDTNAANREAEAHVIWSIVTGAVVSLIAAIIG